MARLEIGRNRPKREWQQVPMHAGIWHQGGREDQYVQPHSGYFKSCVIILTHIKEVKLTHQTRSFMEMIVSDLVRLKSTVYRKT